MNRRGFAGITLAGLSGLLFPQKLKTLDSEYVVEEITEFTETRYPIPERCGYRGNGYFISKGRHHQSGEIMEACPFSSYDSALEAIKILCQLDRRGGSYPF